MWLDRGRDMSNPVYIDFSYMYINVGGAEGKGRSHTLGDVCRRSKFEERGEDVVEAKRVERVNAMSVRDLGENMMSDRVILICSGDLERTRCKY